MCKKCLIEKFFHFAKAILENSEELGISESDAKKIKELKIKAKKEMIMGKAEAEVLGVDILAKLWEEKSDAEGINKLVEKKYDLKKENLKKLLMAFITLKGYLSKEQMMRLKSFCKADKQGQSREEQGRCCH